MKNLCSLLIGPWIIGVVCSYDGNYHCIFKRHLLDLRVSKWRKIKLDWKDQGAEWNEEYDAIYMKLKNRSDNMRYALFVFIKICMWLINPKWRMMFIFLRTRKEMELGRSFQIISDINILFLKTTATKTDLKQTGHTYACTLKLFERLLLFWPKKVNILFRLFCSVFRRQILLKKIIGKLWISK